MKYTKLGLVIQGFLKIDHFDSLNMSISSTKWNEGF